jgi:hypothetical protein
VLRLPPFGLHLQQGKGRRNLCRASVRLQKPRATRADRARPLSLGGCAGNRSGSPGSRLPDPARNAVPGHRAGTPRSYRHYPRIVSILRFRAAVGFRPCGLPSMCMSLPKRHLNSAAKKSISPTGSQSVCTPQSAHLLTSFDSDIVREPTSPGKHFVVGCGAEVPSRPR